MIFSKYHRKYGDMLKLIDLFLTPKLLVAA